jgi:hypothetical protein
MPVCHCMELHDSLPSAKKTLPIYVKVSLHKAIIYCNVPGVLSTMELDCTPKSQHTTVKTQSATLRTHVHVQPVRSRNTNSNRILPTGPLVAIFQHELTFLVRKSPNTRRDNPSSDYRSTCTPQQHLDV